MLRRPGVPSAASKGDIGRGREPMRLREHHRVVGILLGVLLWPAVGAAGTFSLRYVDHTGVEIVMAWDPVPEATAYVVERDTTSGFSSGGRVVYTVPATVTGFGDTGWPLDDASRF